MSLREANRSREKNGPWVAIATRDRDILSPRGARMYLSLHLFIFSPTVLFTTTNFRDTRRSSAGGYREVGRETEKRRESRLPARAFRQIEFAGAKASG